MSDSETTDDLLELADACQAAADQIAARLTDFDHPLNQAFRLTLMDQEGKLRVCAHALRLQALDQIAAEGTEARNALDEAAKVANAAVKRIKAIEQSVAIVGALLQLAGAIAVAAGGGSPAGIIGAAKNLIDVTKPLLASS